MDLVEVKFKIFLLGNSDLVQYLKLEVLSVYFVCKSVALQNGDRS